MTPIDQQLREKWEKEAEQQPAKLGWDNDGTAESEDIKRAYLAACEARHREYQERVATLYTQDELLEAFEAGSSFASEYERGHRGKDYKAFKKELDAYRASLSPPPAKQQEP